MQREEWLTGKTKMWDVFPDDMGLDNSVELALANLDLNEPVLEPITFDDGDPLEGSSSTQIDAQIALDIEEEVVCCWRRKEKGLWSSSITVEIAKQPSSSPSRIF
jgi:hypothetical protein